MRFTISTWLMVYDERLEGYRSICKLYKLLYIHYLASILDGAMHKLLKPNQYIPGLNIIHLRIMPV